MRKLILNLQTTLNNRIATGDGTFWEPFPWGDTEQAFTNEFYRGIGTWVMTRPIFEAIVPWWDMVARGEVPADIPAVSETDLEFAAIFDATEKIAITRTMPGTSYRVLHGDLAASLASLKSEPGTDIVLAVGPATLAPLLKEPGLIDEFFLVIHPALVGTGPRLFDEEDLALRLIEATAFPAGAIVTRYEVLS